MEHRCAGCGLVGFASVNERFSAHELRWSRSFQCACGDGLEEDCFGPAPEELKAFLLAATGAFEVWVSNADALTRSRHVLRRLLKISSQDVVKKVPGLPGVIHRGTEAEVAWLAEGLIGAGVECLVRPA